MIFKIEVTTIFNCSLERAFKTPMLCDVTKVHTGFGLTPRVTHTTDDDNWGQIGSSKKIFVAKSLTQKAGYASMDRILEREENKYWKIQVDDFQSWMAGFYKFVGEWKTTQIEVGKIQVDYTYQLHSDKPHYYLLNWLFAKLFWPIYMRRVMHKIKMMAYDKEPYIYD